MPTPLFPVSQAAQSALESAVADTLLAACGSDAASLHCGGFAISAVRAGQRLVCRIARQANVAEYVDISVAIPTPGTALSSRRFGVKHFAANSVDHAVSTY